MTPEEFSIKLFGDDARLVVVGEMEVESSCGLRIIRPMERYAPLWRVRLSWAIGVAERLGIDLTDSGHLQDDMVVEYEIRPVTFGELRRKNGH